MPQKRQSEPEKAFEQTRDASGRIRLDRRLTPEEAAAQDEANRVRYVEGRAGRFSGVPEGE